MNKTKSKIKHIDQNPIEKMLGLSQILGFSDSKEKQQDDQEMLMIEGQEINLKEFAGQKHEKKEKPQAEPGINYAREIIHAAERTFIHENREIEAQLKDIMDEIKKLADSSKELQMQFKEVAIEQHVVKPGKYHKTFFSWLLSIIRNARLKIEDSGAWLAAMHSKKKSREYGAMSKKFGTTFSLSNERVVATQVG